MQKRYMRKILILSFVFLMIFSMAAGVRAQNDEEYNSFDKFQQVLYLLKNHHVNEMSYDKLLKGAMNGMLQEADPFSYYLTPDEYEEMQVEFEGHFGGIGIRIVVLNGKLTIVSPIKGTPGARVGLEAKDIITHVDGEPTSEMTQKEAVDMMRGEPGTDVEITIKREGKDKPLDFNITRADIEVPNVTSEMETDEIGYISVVEFVQDVGLKVKKSITSLKAEGARAIILDLRSNPGGLLNEAVNVSSSFIEDGTIVSARQREGDPQIYKTSSDIKAVDLPLVVLTNGGSASASEIVSAAVRDHDRGQLVGTRTFGKGTVQRIIPLQDGSAVKMTIARYYTPDGDFIHEKGIEPDINIKYDPEQEEDNQINKAIELLNKKLEEKEKKLAG